MNWSPALTTAEVQYHLLVLLLLSASVYEIQAQACLKKSSLARVVIRPFQSHSGTKISLKRDDGFAKCRA